MEQVLLIAGNSMGFLEKTRLMFDFLKEGGNLSGNMKLLRTAYMDREGFWEEMKSFLEQESKMPLFLLYFFLQIIFKARKGYFLLNLCAT